MAFKYIDDSAFSGCTNDGPRSAAAMTMLRNNIAHSWSERGTRAGIQLHRPARICSPYPIAYGPFMLDLGEERYDYINVHLYVSEVDWSKDATDTPDAGSNAVYLCATCCSPDGRLDNPLRDPEDWGDWCVSGSMPLTTTATDQIVTLKAPVGNRKNFVGVLVWVLSVVSTDAESSTTVVDINFPNDSVIVSAAPENTNQPPERAAVGSDVMEKAGGTDTIEMGSMAIVGSYMSKEGKHLISLLPAISSGDYYAIEGGDYTLDYYTMGVLEFSGLSCEGVPKAYPGPGTAACNAGRPLEEDLMAGLVATTSHIARNRVRTYSCGLGTGYIGEGYDDWYWWSIFAKQFNGTVWDHLDTGNTTVHEVIISQPPPSVDRAGYRACVAVYAQRNRSAEEQNIKLQLSLDDLSDNTTYANYGNNHTLVNLKWQEYFSNARAMNWGPLQQTVYRSIESQQQLQGSYQTRGALIDPGVAWGGADTIGDFHRLQWLYCELAEPEGVSYPALMRIELSTEDRDWEATSQAVVVAVGLSGRAL